MHDEDQSEHVEDRSDDKESGIKDEIQNGDRPLEVQEMRPVPWTRARIIDDPIPEAMVVVVRRRQSMDLQSWPAPHEPEGK